MTPADYEKILAALAGASEVLQSHQGVLSAADIRIRCLIDITAKEAKRALLEMSLSARVSIAAEPACAPIVSGSSAP